MPFLGWQAIAKPAPTEAHFVSSPPELSRRQLWVRLLLYPSHTLPTAAAPVIVAIGLAIRDHVFAPVPTLVGFLGSWLIHVAGVFTDNYELLRQHPHLPEHPELLRGVENGSLRLHHLAVAIWTCFVLAFLTAPYLLDVGGILVLFFGIIGAAASFSYAGGRYAYAKRGLADPIFFLMFAEVAVVATYYIQAVSFRGLSSFHAVALNAFPRIVFVIGLPIGALVTDVLIIDDMRDREFDAKKQWLTPAVRFGIGWSRVEFTVLMVLAYLSPFVVWLALERTFWILLPLLTAPWSAVIVRSIWTLERPPDLAPMTAKMARLGLIYALFEGVGLALGR